MLRRDGRGRRAAGDVGELVLLLDRDLIIRLQHRRPDLYFVHAAVLEAAGGAVMLVAPSGGGKSTMAWALLHHGFAYLSDELAPVDLTALTVYPYPRALTLKSDPPPAYPLPRGTLCTSRGFHVAPTAMPAPTRRTPVPLRTIFFLDRTVDVPPAIQRLTAAAATARLYPNVLNGLAHPGQGLEGAIRLSRHVPSFELRAGGLTAAPALVSAALRSLPPC
ncbi:MAG TPA: hypothetical protein VNO23_18955 [Candidatus Binatia bacterium]|nr:hypothetical protein [Candidatus Binatia bacterium]